MSRRILFILFFGFIFLAAVIRFASASNEPIQMDFFYSNNCRSCLEIKENFLPKLKAKYKDKIIINYHNIAYANALEFKLALQKKYGEGKAVPQIYLPTVVLEGKEEIKNELVDAIDEILQGSAQPVIEKIVPEKSLIFDKFSSFSPAIITSAGLVDGINPCAFAAIVFFISFLTLNSYRKDQIAYVGSAFIVAVFLTYLALGLGIFQAFKRLQVFSLLSQLLYYVIALLALGLGIYSLRDYIKYKRTGETKGCSLKIYNRLRSLTESRRGFIVLIIGAFINGFIIALLESVCTGQVYFPTIAFVMKVPRLRISAFLYLVLYNLAFIVPLVGVFLLAYKGFTSEKVALFTNRHLGGIKLATTILFFSLAALLFVL